MDIVVVMSKQLLEKVKLCEIRSEVDSTSDHCPLVWDIEESGKARGF